MKEEIVKIETVPTKLTELEKRKDELTKLVTDTSLITINGIKDIEGYKTAEKNRKLVKKEIGIIEKTRKEIKAPVLKIGLEIDNVAKELTAILEPENKRLVTITKAHEAEVEAEKQRQIQEQKEKTIKRIKDIHDCKPEFDGYTYSFGEVSINLDKIEALTDEGFNNELNCFKTIRIDLDKEAKEKEQLKIDLLISRKQQLKLIIKSNHWADMSDKELLDLSDNDFNRIVNDRNCDLAMFSNNKARMVDFLLSCGYEEVESGFEHDNYGFVGKLSVEGLNDDDFNIDIKRRKKGLEEIDRRLQEEQKQEREAKKLRLQKIAQDEAQKIIDEQREEIRIAQEKVKEEADRLERERKEKEAKELAIKKALEDEENAKKAKIKADKEAEEKRKADVERQDRLKRSKNELMNIITYCADKLEETVRESEGMTEKEVIELCLSFENDHDLLIQEYIGEINNL